MSHPLHPKRLYADIQANPRQAGVAVLALLPVYVGLLVGSLHAEWVMTTGLERGVALAGGPERFAWGVTGLVFGYGLGFARLDDKLDSTGDTA